MGTYIYSILCAALAVSVINALAPENEGLSKYIAFAGALAVALCVLFPIASGSDISLPGLFDEPLVSETSDSRAEAEYTARNAVLSFSAMSGAKTDSIYATVEFRDNTTYVTLECDEYIVGSIEDIEETLGDILGVKITIISGGDK